MRKVTLFAFGVGITAGALTAAAHHGMKAHEHGRGTLNIAIENTRVSVELEAPGADIVGFEHAAKTARQKEAVEKGKKQLLAVQNLFKFPAAAGCTIAEAKAELEDDDHGHDHAADQAAHGKDAARHGGDDEAHSIFHGQYAFTCSAPERITVIEFGYFRVFSGAQKLEVNVITSKGQSKFEVTRAKPRIDLAGMM